MIPSPTMTLRRFTAYGGVLFRVALSPDGQTLVYWQRINGKDSLWLGQVETNTSVLLNDQQGLKFDNLVFTPAKACISLWLALTARSSNVCVTQDGRSVVFQSNRSGGIEIWRVNSDGSNLKQMTTGGNNSQPSLSPDGQWIIYKSTLAGRTTLSRISIDGGQQTEITESPAQSFQVSPDQKFIACAVSSSRRLLIIPFAGGPPAKSFPMPETAFRAIRLHWTLDGKAVVYKGGASGLLWQSLDEAIPHPFKGFEQLAVRNFAWSFDGKNFAYSSGPTTQEIILIEHFK